MNAAQLPLAAFQSASPTSRAAAEMVNVSHQERMILVTVYYFGDLTQDEIAEKTGLLRSAVSGRCNRMDVYKGLLRKDGVRNTRYGRPAAVYRITDEGREALFSC